MEITVIHGQKHKGSTYETTQRLVQNIADKDAIIHEFFMISDTPPFCIGCYNCFLKGEEFCPHYEIMGSIVSAMERSDLIVINSPTYVYGMTGQLKTFFDHLGYIWLAHRPRKSMFRKVAVVISTTAGAGAKSVTKEIKRQLFWYGIPKVFRLNFSVFALKWDGISEKNKAKIEKKCSRVATQVKKRLEKGTISLKSRGLFYIMRSMHKTGTMNEKDFEYWKENGWFDKKRPW